MDILGQFLWLLVCVVSLAFFLSIHPFTCMGENKFELIGTLNMLLLSEHLETEMKFQKTVALHKVHKEIC